MTKKELSEAAKILAKQGGKATLKKYGKEHYKKMIKKRWDNVRAEENLRKLK